MQETCATMVNGAIKYGQKMSIHDWRRVYMGVSIFLFGYHLLKVSYASFNDVLGPTTKLVVIC